MEEHQYQLQFARQLKRLRQLRRLTLDELARRTGLSRSSLAAYERGTGNPSLEALACLSSVLRVSISQLLGEEAQRSGQTWIDWEFLLLDCVADALDFSPAPVGRQAMLCRMERSILILSRIQQALLAQAAALSQGTEGPSS